MSEPHRRASFAVLSLSISIKGTHRFRRNKVSALRLQPSFTNSPQNLSETKANRVALRVEAAGTVVVPVRAFDCNLMATRHICSPLVRQADQPESAWGRLQGKVQALTDSFN